MNIEASLFVEFLCGYMFMNSLFSLQNVKGKKKNVEKFPCITQQINKFYTNLNSFASRNKEMFIRALKNTLMF